MLVTVLIWNIYENKLIRNKSEQTTAHMPNSTCCQF